MFYFIVNTKSKTGRSVKVWHQIEEELHNRHVEYEAFLTSHAGHAGKLAAALCREKQAPLDIVVFGGDGTVNEVINGIDDFTKVRLGYLPTGSGNDFGRGLKLPQDALKGLENILESKKTVQIDLGIVTSNLDETGHRFAISSGIGLDAAVCYEANHTKLKKRLNRIGLGKLTYVLLTLRQIFVRERTDAKIETDGLFAQDASPIQDTKSMQDGKVMQDEKKIQDKKFIQIKDMVFAAAMNLPAEGGGVPMAPDANPRDGKLMLCCFYGKGRLATLLRFPLLIVGKQKSISTYRMYPFSECKIHTKMPVTLHFDGEYGGEVTDVIFSCLPQKLTMFV